MTELITVYCNAGCGCQATVPNPGWIKALCNLQEDHWMVMVWGQHQHTATLCSLKCLKDWAQNPVGLMVN